ncbi:MAG: diguanylate cyclase, partial [Synergistaceae bacterium]|nr:diguanylate cyclase [Synergistaceae bacterium]
EIKKESNKFILYGIILGIIVLLTAIALLSYIISLISEPITKLTNNISNIVNGNLGISIDVKSEDEVGYLAQSLQKIADILHKLLDDINHMISEQEKGNTEYSLNADEFLGDYKILADNILDLAELGMRDQMTGIPNKRGFDKRLDLEWNRAIREKTLISILMIDLDKFKNYNDTFGNQQGDAALKAIAKTIKQSTKRSIDFAARWGGGEFVILLPTTDSIGAMSVAANVRTEIENSLIPCEDPRAAKLTVSIGVNTLMPEPTDSIGEFISIVNGALYKAKETGRNRVVLGRAEK